MPRTPRSHLPGAVFHLTARTQGHRSWFTERLRTPIAEYLASSVRVSDAQLLAWAVMPNHLHLVIRQGAWPLGRIMLPLLTRVAALVQRAHSIEGHVFERRFRDRACMDPDHVRNAIVYTHLNPVRAGLSDQPAAYSWTSHGMYAAEGAEPSYMGGVLRAEMGLGLFAHREGLSREELREAYRRHVERRVERDHDQRTEILGDDAAPATSRSAAPADSLGWSRALTPLFRPHVPAHDDPLRPRKRDLGEIVQRTLIELNVEIALERVRSSCKERAVVRVRRVMVHRMSEAGYSGRAIARYLRISPQCVSNILVRESRARFS